MSFGAFGGGGGPLDVSVRILFETNPQALQAASMEARVLEGQLGAIAARGPQVGQTFNEFAVELQTVAQRLGVVNQMLATTGNGFGLTQGQAFGAASAVQGVARGFEDVILSGGRFASAINNVPQVMEGVARAAGLSNAAIAALSAGSTVFAAALFLAIDNWSLLMRLMGSGKLKTEAEEMSELGKKTEKTVEELERYLALKERQRAMESQEKNKTEAESVQKKEVNKAIVEGDEDNIRKGLIETGRDELIATDPGARAAEDAVRARSKFLGEGEVSPEVLKRRQGEDFTFQQAVKERDKEIGEAARRLMGDAETIPKRLDQLINFANKSPGSFPKGFADRLGAVSPEGQKENKALDEEIKAMEHDIARRLHAFVRAARGAAKDDSLTEGEKVEKVGGTLADLNRSGLVGDDVARAREQIEDMLAGARHAHVQGVESAENEAEAMAQKIGDRLSSQIAKDLGRELQDIVGTTAKDPAGRIGRIQGLAEKVGGAGLSGPDRAALGQQLVNALHAARNQADAAAAQAGKHADTAADAAARKLAPGVQQAIQAAILQNQMAANAGAPHLDPAALRDELRQRVGFDLNRAGANPALAGKVVQNAETKLAPMMSAASSRIGTTMDAVSDNQMMLSQVLGQVQADMARIDAKVNHVRANLHAQRGGGLPALAGSVRGQD